MLRRILPLVALLSLPSIAAADGLSAGEAAKKMQLPPGFSVRAVASEPMIRQPVSISFDDRGRMWVLQYLQYPNYAGLKPVKQDQYLRTIWDKVPEPPPHGPKGLDRLTICYDPDENGVYRKSKDFITGLNIASGFCLGNGGVYVVQPPYLLFYPDKNEDDVPDGDPEVLLSGFGMDDTHSLANSLQFGPDGWLYGAAGSTSTCKIRSSVAHAPGSPEVIEFQQGIWRYHPKTKRFELFSEGGGNTYGLDFDRHGQAIAGTNWGGFAMLHQMQGAYYIKGFSKHGPLHNPHTYGYFDHVPYTGFKGGHVTCGGIVYQADAYPPQYRDQYIAANLLSNCINWHKMEPIGSSFKAAHGGEMIQANDPWFRPVDCLQGPDGSVYVVDFYDRRAAHLDPVDNWDKTNGRVYKLEYQPASGRRQPPEPRTFDLRQKTSAELAELLKHPNKWWRNEARRILGERQDKSVHPRLRQWLVTEKGNLALEALWALYVSGGWMERDFDQVGSHPNEYVRAWTVRFIGDEQRTVSDFILPTLEEMARTETSPAVVAQLACTAKRLPPEQCYELVSALIDNKLCNDDAQIPLLVWWAMEGCNTRDKTDTVRFPYPGGLSPKAQDFFNERVARRLMSGDIQRGYERIPTLFELTRDANASLTPVLKGVAMALQTKPLDAVPSGLVQPLERLWKEKPKAFLVLEVLARMSHDPVRAQLRTMASDASVPVAERLKAIDLLRQVRDPKAKDLFLAEFLASKSDALRVGLLAGLEAFDDPAIGEKLLAGYSSTSPAVKKRTVQALLVRPAWALALLQQFTKGTFPQADFTVEQAKAAVRLGDKAVTAMVEKHFGKLAPATAGEKQARISWLSVQLTREKPGDIARGKALFTKHCAACHQLHGEGGKIGPDLTTADRKNRGYLLANIVDPSGFIRPEFVVQNVSTVDGRKLSGIAVESGGTITLTNVINDKPESKVIARGDIETIAPSAVSLMPEKLLDTLTYQEIADLFAYMGSDAKSPAANAPGSPVAKKLKVLLISGSFEYKSDTSLADFQKYLEANYAVECKRAFATSDKDKDLPGLEQLEACDVAIFFTRRLQIEDNALDRVKKYVELKKPIVGIRTASHGFQNWLEMDKLVLGGDYKGHFGQNVECDVTIEPKAKDHPVLKGVAPFKTRGGLYKNADVAADVTVLLRGTIPEGSEPVAWVRQKDGRRVFYTSLGTPDDFKDPNFIRLLANGLAWTTKTELKK
jgi:putative membrane-bound dehydrogenase-like protein